MASRRIPGHGRWRVTVNAPSKNDGPNWRLRYRGPDGKVTYRSSGTTDRDRAERAAAAEERRMNGDQRCRSVLEVFDLHLATLRVEGSVTKATIRNYDSARRALLPLVDGIGVNELTPDAIAKIRIGLGKRLRSSTVRKYLQALAAAWSWAYAHPGDSGVTTPWVAPRLRRTKSRAKAARTVKRPFTVDELAALLTTLSDGPWLTIAWLLMDTGARVSEVLACDGRAVYEDVDGAWLRLSDTKTGIPRSVPLLADTRDSLKIGRGPLFVSPRRKQRMDASSVWDGLKRAIAKAGIDNDPQLGGSRPVYPLDVHSLRRSWIAHSERAGVPRPVAMLITGHEMQGVHDRYGRNARGDDLHAAVRQVRAWRHQTCSPALGQRSALVGIGLSGDAAGCSGATAFPSWTVEESAQTRDAQGLQAGGENRPALVRHVDGGRRGSRCPLCGLEPRPPPRARWKRRHPRASTLGCVGTARKALRSVVVLAAYRAVPLAATGIPCSATPECEHVTNMSAIGMSLKRLVMPAVAVWRHFVTYENLRKPLPKCRSDSLVSWASQRGGDEPTKRPDLVIQVGPANPAQRGPCLPARTPMRTSATRR